MSSLTWNPSNKGASATLSNANKTVSIPQLFTGAVGTIGRDGSDVNGFYLELTIGAAGGDGFTSLDFGFAQATWSSADQASTGNRLGETADTWGITTNSNSYNETLHNNTPGPSTGGLPTGGFGSQAIGQTFGLLLKAGHIYIYGTGASAGTIIDWSAGVSGIVYPATGAMQHDPRNQQVTINGGDSPWVGTLPAGAKAWSPTTNPSNFFAVFN